MSSHGTKHPVSDYTPFSQDGLLSPTLVPIENYWWEACADGQIPSHAELDPRALACSLEHTLLMKRLGTSEARINVSGRSLVNAMGVEPTGLPLSLFFTVESRPYLADVTRQLFEDQCAVLLDVKFATGPLRVRKAAQFLLLPLRDSFGQVTRILGGTSLDAPQGSAPRFDIVSSMTRQVDAAAYALQNSGASRRTRNGKHILKLVKSDD